MFVYKITNQLNGRIYIGQHVPNCNAYFGSGPLIKQAIDLYGKTNFTREIIERCTSRGELNATERKWIIELNATDPEIGYNKRIGFGNIESFGIYDCKHKQNFAKQLLKGQAKHFKHLSK